MAIKIEQSAGIPVTIAGLEFEFDLSDEHIKSLVDLDNIVNKKISEFDFSEFEDELDGITEEILDESLKKTAIILKLSFDELLGKGTFEKIYKKVPSTVQLTLILAKLNSALEQELEELGEKAGKKQSEKAQSYLKAKKAKK
ncbi:hypothetical protein [Listeria valentina]|uniref:hypothetical protein n=1 Tax=Listeria valentina TaxID=2705293 RepID=UPI001431F2FE|nr:hypothetical protein [Listeria valentina]